MAQHAATRSAWCRHACDTHPHPRTSLSPPRTKDKYMREYMPVLEAKARPWCGRETASDRATGRGTWDVPRLRATTGTASGGTSESDSHPANNMSRAPACMWLQSQDVPASSKNTLSNDFCLHYSPYACVHGGARCVGVPCPTPPPHATAHTVDQMKHAAAPRPAPRSMNF